METIKLEKIENGVLLIDTYFKRKFEIVNEAYELSALCDVEIALIGYLPWTDVLLFPTDNRLENVIRRYRSLSLAERMEGRIKINNENRTIMDFENARNEVDMERQMKLQRLLLLHSVRKAEMEKQLWQHTFNFLCGRVPLNSITSLNQLEVVEKMIEQKLEKLRQRIFHLTGGENQHRQILDILSLPHLPQESSDPLGEMVRIDLQRKSSSTDPPSNLYGISTNIGHRTGRENQQQQSSDILSLPYLLRERSDPLGEVFKIGLRSKSSSTNPPSNLSGSSTNTNTDAIGTWSFDKSKAHWWNQFKPRLLCSGGSRAVESISGNNQPALGALTREQCQRSQFGRYSLDVPQANYRNQVHLSTKCSIQEAKPSYQVRPPPLVLLSSSSEGKLSPSPGPSSCSRVPSSQFSSNPSHQAPPQQVSFLSSQGPVPWINPNPSYATLSPQVSPIPSPSYRARSSQIQFCPTTGARTTQ